MTVKNPDVIIKNLSSFFKKSIKQKELKLEINENLGGDRILSNLVNRRGIMLEVQLFEQIIYNVFANACKFNKNKGVIKCKVAVERYGEKRMIKDYSEPDKMMLVTEISDSGEGMSKKKIKQLFKIFESIRDRELNQNFIDLAQESTSLIS